MEIQRCSFPSQLDKEKKHNSSNKVFVQLIFIHHFSVEATISSEMQENVITQAKLEKNRYCTTFLFRLKHF